MLLQIFKLTCEWSGCTNDAEFIAKGRDSDHKSTGYYCRAHAESVADEDSPEYVVNCPNCGCRFGVN